MIEEIKGIYRIKTPLPGDVTHSKSFGYVNTYLVPGSKGYLILDPGMNTDEAFNTIKNALEEIGIGFKDISQIVISHAHPDHNGMVGKLKELTNAIYLIHAKEKFVFSPANKQENDPARIGKFFAAYGVPSENSSQTGASSFNFKKYVIPATPDVLLQGGETISTGTFNFQVIWTPGHSPGHICLYEAERKVLLSGDHILPHITPHIGLSFRSGDDCLGDYINSLQSLKKLDVQDVLPGHQKPFTGLNRRIDEMLEHHRKRCEAILEIIKIEPKTAYQISESLLWHVDTEGKIWQKLSSFDKQMALIETLAHLNYLQLNGKVEQFMQDDVIYFKPATPLQIITPD